MESSKGINFLALRDMKAEFIIDFIIFLVFIVVTITGLGVKEGLKYIFIIMTLFCISKIWDRWKMKKEEDEWRKYKDSLPEEVRKEVEKFEEKFKKE